MTRVGPERVRFLLRQLRHKAHRNGVEVTAPRVTPYINTIPPELQRYMAERAKATIVEVPASHVSFVSQPEAATQLILQAVEATATVG